MVKLEYVKTDGAYEFRDALYLPDDHQLNDSDIEAIKQKRFDDWVTLINTPPEAIVAVLSEEI